MSWERLCNIFFNKLFFDVLPCLKQELSVATFNKELETGNGFKRKVGAVIAVLLIVSGIVTAVVIR